jgi:hypothetical protein
VEAGLGVLPANTWRVTDLIKSVTSPWAPINTPLSIELKIPYSTCSSPLVKVPVSSTSGDEALSGVESSLR